MVHTEPLRRFVVASGNAGKVREIARLFDGCEVLSLAGWPGIAFPEEGDDYAENARVKAKTVLAATGIASLADDSGIEVELLGGRPGVYSARYGGPGLDDRGRVVALLRELEPFAEPRRARFVCVAACVLADGRALTARGECAGVVVRSARGSDGFGYDPIFVPEGFDRTWAELEASDKDRVSHRGRAFRALRAAIEALSRS